MSSIPKQYRVTLKTQIGSIRTSNRYVQAAGEFPQGFLVPYTSGISRTYLKKKDMQDRLAYQEYGIAVTDLDGKIYIKGTVWEGAFPNTKQIFIDQPVADKLQPKIIDNIPLSGFEVRESISRRPTGNKLWKILDPRGFEVVITTGAMQKIVMSCTIIKGKIVEECIWSGAKTLLPA